MSIDENYEVVFTEECRKEIRRTYKYIKENLYADNAARNLMNKIQELISNLASTPKMYEEIKSYMGLKRRYRRIIIDNYVLLYTIDDEKKQVYVSHMYCGVADYLMNMV